MFVMDPTCHLCFWDKPFILFKDSDYPSSTKFKHCSYNPIINPNGYQNIPVCYFCLIDKIYGCDMTLKSSLLSEIRTFFYIKSITKIQHWWIKNIYDISTPLGKKFVYSKLSDKTKISFSFCS